MTAMMAPRPTLLIYNQDDNAASKPNTPCSPSSMPHPPSSDSSAKNDYLRTHINFDPGTHNYEQENREALYRMLGRSLLWRESRVQLQGDFFRRRNQDSR